MASTNAMEEAWTPIIADMAASSDSNIKFDPNKHLAFEEPKHIYSMTDLGYAADTGISPVAASEPFKLFTKQAIRQFRNEIFSPAVMENCKYSGSLGACMLRGYAAKYAPFVYDAWYSPETLAIVSKIAGVELVPNMDFEIGHINISVQSQKQAEKERAEAAKQQSDKNWKDTAATVGWHNDSYPFVCVTMLSDCTNMVGGETVLRTADGNVVKVRGPEMGCAVVLQGRYITHQALRALGAQERITMVTSFRAKSPYLADDSVLNTVRGTSNLSELYFGYAEYRLAILEERIRSHLNDLRRKHTAGKKTETKSIKQFLEDSMTYLDKTNHELVPDDEVVAGYQPTLDIPDAMLEDQQDLAKPLKAML